MRFRFHLGQMLLLTALAALVLGLGTSIFQRVRSLLRPEAVSFSPDGKYAAARFIDGTVNVWNVDGGAVASFDTSENYFDVLGRHREFRLLDDQRAVRLELARLFEQTDRWDEAMPHYRAAAEKLALRGSVPLRLAVTAQAVPRLPA